MEVCRPDTVTTGSTSSRTRRSHHPRVHTTSRSRGGDTSLSPPGPTATTCQCRCTTSGCRCTTQRHLLQSQCRRPSPARHAEVTVTGTTPSRQIPYRQVVLVPVRGHQQAPPASEGPLRARHAATGTPGTASRGESPATPSLLRVPAPPGPGLRISTLHPKSIGIFGYPY